MVAGVRGQATAESLQKVVCRVSLAGDDEEQAAMRFQRQDDLVRLFVEGGAFVDGQAVDSYECS